MNLSQQVELIALLVIVGIGVIVIIALPIIYAPVIAIAILVVIIILIYEIARIYKKLPKITLGISAIIMFSVIMGLAAIFNV